jgi:hypothetical protein
MAQNAPFSRKTSSFEYSLSRQSDSLWWKMFACHHSKVHPGNLRRGGASRTAGRFACAFLGLVLGDDSFPPDGSLQNQANQKQQ